MIVRNVTSKVFTFTEMHEFPFSGSEAVDMNVPPGHGLCSEAYPEAAEALREHNAKHCPQETKKWMPKVYLSKEVKPYFIGGCI